MAENKKSFVVYTSWKTFLDDLTTEQLGTWFKWVMDYCNDTNPEYPQDQAARLACKMTQDVLKRDLKKYELKVESIKTARENRKLNNKNNIENNIDINNEINNDIAPKSVQNQTEISSVNVNDNVNVNVNDNVLSKDNVNNISVINNTCSKSDLNGSVNEDKFSQFWKEYPKKVGKDKCQKWFKTHKVTSELLNKMLDTISKFKQSKGWLKDNGQYIPHPYTWLNRGGWNDELEESSNNSSIDVEWEELPPLTDEDCKRLGFIK